MTRWSWAGLAVAAGLTAVGVWLRSPASQPAENPSWGMAELTRRGAAESRRPGAGPT